MSTTTAAVTAFGDDTQLYSTWPAGIVYNPNEDKYTYSVKSTWLVQPLDHFHVVDIDLTASPPYTMTLQLPIMNTIPFNSRIYFFYVSRSNNTDVLTFIPTSGSGNTVNGNAVSFSFTMTGAKKLFLCIGTASNYVIHEVGGAGAGPSAAARPLLMFRALQNPGGSTSGFTLPSPYSGGLSSTGASNSTCFTSSGYSSTPDPLVYIPGMDGYVTYSAAIPNISKPGFRVNNSGVYRVTYSCGGLYLVNGQVGQNVNVGATVMQLNATGTTSVDTFTFAGTCNLGSPNTGPSCCWNATGSRIFHFVGGNYVIGGVQVINSSALPTAQGTQVDFSTWTFELLQLDPTGLDAPSFFSVDGSIAPIPSDSLDSAASAMEISPMHAPAPTSEIQLAQRKFAAAASAGASISSASSSQQAGGFSSSQSSAPSFSLSDVERIINQAISAKFAGVDSLREAAPGGPHPAKRKRGASSSSSSTSSSNSAQQLMEDGGEKEIL